MGVFFLFYKSMIVLNICNHPNKFCQKYTSIYMNDLKSLIILQHDLACKLTVHFYFSLYLPIVIDIFILFGVLMNVLDKFRKTILAKIKICYLNKPLNYRFTW